MPWFAWVIVSIATTALMGPPAAWSPQQATNPSPKRYSASPVEYMSWTSSPTILQDGTCRYTVFALVTREQVTRVQLQGMEQLLDWSWSEEWELKQGERGEYHITFLNPVGGAVVADQAVWEWCRSNKEVW